MNYQAGKSEQKIGVLLLSYGGTSRIDEIEPFLKSITGLQQIPENYYRMAREKYEIIGGRSPFKEISSAQMNSLQKALGNNFVVQIGFRHTEPSIKQAIEHILSSRTDLIIGLCLTPHYSTLSCGDYIKTAKDYLNELAPQVPYYFVNSWHKNPDYIRNISERIKGCLTESATKKSCILFTAHSLPIDKIPTHDPYEKQLKETISLVKDKLKLSKKLKYRLAYQSRRPGKDSWLEPEAQDELNRIKHSNFETVLVVPLSFVSDNLETLYDIDIVLKKQAIDLGIDLRRIPSFNTDKDFIETLKKIIIKTIKENKL